mgnify:CR=1 FL=1
MARIDIQTLVMVFEKRIEALEKNPPHQVPMAVIVNMLEKSIDEIIKEHFVHLVKKDMEKLIKKQFDEMKSEFIKKTLENILTDSVFRQTLENRIKGVIIHGIK